jgi:hypothetical protein
MRVVGISQKIKRAWLDVVLDRMFETKDEKELRLLLDSHLREELPGKESRAKAAGIVLRIWSGVDSENVGIRNRAVALLPRISGQERMWLHWGMAALAYPFFRDLAEVVGRRLMLQDDISTAQVQSRLTSTWGDRNTSKEAAQKLITSLVDWEVLRGTDAKGHFLLCRKMTTAVTELQLWLLEAVLSASASDEIEAHQLLRLPELFPFSFTVSVADLRRHEGFNIHRQGLDMDMVSVRQVKVDQPKSPTRAGKSKKEEAADLPTLFDEPKVEIGSGNKPENSPPVLVDAPTFDGRDDGTDQPSGTEEAEASSVEFLETHNQPYFFIAPLKGWDGTDGPITGNLSIKRGDDLTFPDLDEWAYFLSQHDLRELKSVRHWLWYEFESPWPRNTQAEKSALVRFDAVQYSLQILAPRGSRGLVLMARRIGDRLMLESGHHRLPLNETVWGRLATVPGNVLAELPIVIDRIEEAFRRRIIRLQNPVYLLEHGFQATNLHVRVLLWTTGLDSLLMANTRNEFVERLHNLLGAGASIFPPDKIMGRQPKYTVGDVSGDLYELRSEIAHGREIGKKFREKTGFKMVDGLEMSGVFTNYQYRQVLGEAAVFLLASALRKVLSSNLLDEIASERKWRQRLRLAV